MERIRRWLALLATDETAPAWNPRVPFSTPEALRRAARWVVDNGHAPDLDHEMVCILLALYIAEHSAETFVPRDAA